MERHESPPAMVETWPEEPGQSAFPLMDLDVELTSENVRTSDAPVSSRLRSTRCCSIVSGTNPLDQMTMQAANCGTCQSNPLASSMHFHEAPASTAVRNASNNLPHVHHPEARYPDMMNGNGGGYTDRMIDRQAPPTTKPQSLHVMHCQCHFRKLKCNWCWITNRYITLGI